MLVVAFAAALASMVLVPPDEGYLGYLDGKTLGCLFCVLAVANAMRRIGVFDRVATLATLRFENPRTLVMVMLFVTAGISMLFTNDVALVIMLPFSATALVAAGHVRLVPATFALQALAANLCGMVLPFGNPQNLYLYSYFHIGIGDFLLAMVLPFAFSLVGIVCAAWLLTRKEARVSRASNAEVRSSCASHERTANGFAPSDGLGVESANRKGKAAPRIPVDRRRLRAYMVLFAVALLAVLRAIPVVAAVAIIACAIMVSDKRALAEVDYALLGTFVCFFVFAGNMARIPALVEVFVPLMDRWGMVASACLSQVISNVPAAIVLSHFTEAWQPLLIGVNVGGAGTFVGSLASLIAIRYYSLSRKVFPDLRGPDAPTTGSFLRLFAGLNALFFIVLLIACQVVAG